MLWSLLALICIILGFVVGIFDVKLVFEPVVWFVAAIAFNTLSLAIPGVRQSSNE